jgi:muramoyltetrapeptide carboxypeptidase
MPDRRRFLQALGLSALAPLVAGRAAAAAPLGRAAIRPRRLRPGDTVGVVAPSSMVAESMPVEIARESLEAMGLRVRMGAYTRARYGYLSGRDEERADDVNRMFRDPDVNAVFALRGGWGAARILPLLDWGAIRDNPKVLLGYSDVTSLLLAVHARTGLVTFHGPMGISDWTPFPVEHLRSVLFRAEAPTLSNPVDAGDTLVQTRNRIQTIHPGTVRGRLLGGNLTVLSAIVGTPYLPDWDGAILFLEDVGEEVYRMDRMLTHLKLAGILGRIAGFVFGRCTGCGPSTGYGSLTMEELFRDHIAPLGIPAWTGAMIGHITDQWTVPVGAEAEIDASRGTVRLLEPAVA